MPAQQFSSLTELTIYLEQLERRVESLELENKALRSTAEALTDDRVDTERYLRRILPNTGLLSNSFLHRAFTVWGHYFVAQLIISLVFVLLYLCVVGAFLLANLQTLPQ